MVDDWTKKKSEELKSTNLHPFASNLAWKLEVQEAYEQILSSVLAKL